MKSAIQKPAPRFRLRRGFGGQAPLPAASRNGFTIVEMLVVVSVLLLLAGILLPALDLVRQNIRVNLTQSHINLIVTACDMYANDYENNYLSETVPDGQKGGLYPPSLDENIDEDEVYFSNNSTGAEILALLLTGYAPDPDPPGEPYDPDDNEYMSEDDGREGFGFRTVRRGKVYGPYNGAESIPTTTINGRTVFADAFGNPILYYQRNSLSDDFNHEHNPGPVEDYKSYITDGEGEKKDYWDDIMNESDRYILILSPGPDADWSKDGKDEDDIMN